MTDQSGTPGTECAIGLHVEPYFKGDNYYCSVCNQGMGRAYYHIRRKLELEAAGLRERLAKARAEAIEECARVCDRFASRNMHPAECAGAIRALAHPKGADHE